MELTEYLIGQVMQSAGRRFARIARASTATLLDIDYM